MSKRKVLAIICFLVLLIAILAVSIMNWIGPVISYDEAMLTDNISSFESAARICMDYHENNEGVSLFNIDTDKHSLICYNNDGQFIYSLTQEQNQAFVTIISVFRLDHLGLENVFANDNFASFGIANGRASFIYSHSDKKPDFVNSPNEDFDDIYVEKITNNWYYACRQD